MGLNDYFIMGLGALIIISILGLYREHLKQKYFNKGVECGKTMSSVSLLEISLCFQDKKHIQNLLVDIAVKMDELPIIIRDKYDEDIKKEINESK